MENCPRIRNVTSGMEFILSSISTYDWAVIVLAKYRIEKWKFLCGLVMIMSQVTIHREKDVSLHFC